MRDTDAVWLADCVTDGDADSDAVPDWLAEADPEGVADCEAVPEPDRVRDWLCVRVRVLDRVDVRDGVLDVVGLELCDLVRVLLRLFVELRVCVAEAVRVWLAVTLCVCEGVCVPDADCVWLGEDVTLGVRLCVRLGDCVIVDVPVTLLVWVCVAVWLCVSLGVEDTLRDWLSLAEFVEDGVDVTLAVAVALEVIDWLDVPLQDEEPVRLGVPVDEGVAVTVPEAVIVAEGVPDKLALEDVLGVPDALGVPLPDCDGESELLGDCVRVDDCVCVRVRVCVCDALPDGLLVRAGLGDEDCVSEGVRDLVRVALGERVSVLLRERVCDAEPLFACEGDPEDEGSCDGELEALGVTLRLPEPLCVAVSDALPEDDVVWL